MGREARNAEGREVNRIALKKKERERDARTAQPRLPEGRRFPFPARQVAPLRRGRALRGCGTGGFSRRRRLGKRENAGLGTGKCRAPGLRRLAGSTGITDE